MTAPNYRAGGNITPSSFVKISADHTVIIAGANEDAVGISSEAGRTAPIPDVSTVYAGASGDHMKVYGLGDECLLELGGTVTFGGAIKSDGDGHGVAIATTGTTIQEVRAIALEDGVDGDLIRVQIVRDSRRPALA